MERGNLSRRGFLRRSSGALAAAWLPDWYARIAIEALKAGKKLKWEPVAHQCDDAEANRMRSRPPRVPWQLPA